MDIDLDPRHRIVRIRHELRRRLLIVASIETLTPRMLRIHFTSPDLHNFASPAHDDHIKLLFPAADGNMEMRDFTPRRFDCERRHLAIDFALHDTGPAMQWARSAKLGDTLEIGGPRGSSVVPDDFDWYVLIGDETALPAIGRRVEELRAGVSVATFIVTEPGEHQTFQARAQWTPHWIARDRGGDDATLLRAALDGYDMPDGEGFVWIAAEASVARALRTYVVDVRRQPKQWTKAAGYWKRGQADAHERIDD